MCDMSNYGMMSDTDIRNAIQERELCITPFDVNDPDDKRLTPVGFNFSFSRFVVSLNHKTFFKIHEKDDKRYFNLEPGDTAVALTMESIWVSKNIGGTFHSKVGQVAHGLGHISTTLDPFWQGQLLISLNNPSKKSIEVTIAEFISGEWVSSTFITLCMYRMATAASKPSDNKIARLDTLYDIVKKDAKTKEQWQVVNIVKDMLQFLKKQEKGINPGNSDVATEEDMDKFVKGYAVVLEEWDKKYSEIQNLSGRVLLFKKLSNLLPIILAVLLFIVLVIVAARQLSNDSFLIALMTLCSGIFGSVITIFWGKK